MRDPKYLQRLVEDIPALFAHVAKMIGQSRELRAYLGYTTQAVYHPNTDEVLRSVVKSTRVQSMSREWLANNKDSQSSILGSRAEAGSAHAAASKAVPPPTAQATARTSVSSGPVIDLEPHKQAEAGNAARSLRITATHPARPVITSGLASAPAAEKQSSMEMPPRESPRAGSGMGRPLPPPEFNQWTEFVGMEGSGNPYVSSQLPGTTAAGQAGQQVAPPATATSPLSARRDPRLQAHSPRSPASAGPAQAFQLPQRLSGSQPAQAFRGVQISDSARQTLPARQTSLPRQNDLPRQNPQGSGGNSGRGVARKPWLAQQEEAAGEKESAWRVS